MHKAAITVRTIYQIHRAKEIPKSMLARLWDMRPDRFDQLAHQRAEPWLHEALRIAQTQATQPGLWSTCVPFSEMVNASQLTRLRRLYADMVDKHGPESAPRLQRNQEPARRPHCQTV